MNYFKTIAIVLTLVFALQSSICLAQEGIVTRGANGDCVYETTISSLIDRKVYEEIKLINNSSYPLTHITCTITVNGKNHDMRPIPVLKLSDDESFDGYFDDDMNREFPKYFGKEARFSKNNNNAVKFTFAFRDHKDKVFISDVYDCGKDLCFVVQDYTPTPSSVKNPQDVSSASPSDIIVVIDGKTYLIHDGKAYPIQQ